MRPRCCTTRAAHVPLVRGVTRVADGVIADTVDLRDARRRDRLPRRCQRAPRPDGGYDVLLRHDGDRLRAVRRGVDRGKPWADVHQLAAADARPPAPGTGTAAAGWMSGCPNTWSPAAFVLLDDLPRTPNGKLDRRALPSPDPVAPGPRGRLRRAADGRRGDVAGLWAQLLGVDHVGIHDNFFTELGGHSLLATQLVSQLRDTFDVELPLRMLFEAPTVAELTAAVAATTNGAVARSPQAIPGGPPRRCRAISTDSRRTSSTGCSCSCRRQEDERHG